MKKNIILFASFLLLLALSGCSTAADPQPALSNAPSVGEAAAADPGLEKPAGFGLGPVSTKGLAVYGSGQLKQGSDKVSVEIDTKDLNKIKMGTAVLLTNLSDMANPIMYQGTVTGLPDSVSESDDICHIEVTLQIDDETGDESSPSEQPSAVPSADQQSDSSGNHSSSSSVNISGPSGLPASDMSVDTTIYYTKGEQMLTVPISCVLKGADGQSYVWAAEADNPQNITPDSLELKKVETGESDGKVVVILSGLTEKSFVAVAF